jgi:hypothetical protein
MHSQRGKAMTDDTKPMDDGPEPGPKHVMHWPFFNHRPHGPDFVFNRPAGGNPAHETYSQGRVSILKRPVG